MSYRSRMQAVEISYLRGACGVNRVDSESTECINGRVDMTSKGVE